MDVLWRLAWALPLVLLVGAAVALLLRRFVVPASQRQRDRTRMRLRESLPLSEHTCAHLVEIDGKTHVVIESARQLTMQSLDRSAAR